MNPITEYRRQEHLTHADLAERAGCTVNAVLRCEQGLYTKILPCIQVLLPKGSHLAYREWQAEHRLHAMDKLPPERTRKVNMSPLFQWREQHGKSAVGACVILCMHPSTWANMESGKTKSMSTQLIGALNEGGYPLAFIEDLIHDHEEWAGKLGKKSRNAA